MSLVISDSLSACMTKFAMQGRSISSMQFSKGVFKSPSDVITWANKNGVTFFDVSETSQFLVGCMRPAADFEKGSFTVEVLGDVGISAVIGRPRSGAKSESGDLVTAEEIMFKAASTVLIEDPEPMTDSFAVITSGLMSTNTIDRDGDIINPKEFNIGAFMANPQLYINHQPWIEGHNVVTVGSVLKLFLVDIEPSQDDESMLLVSAQAVEGEEPEIVALLQKELFPDMADGAKGLWVVCSITHPEVIGMIERNELNAFSWSGTRFENPNLKQTEIDLFEVSLVTIPANRNAIRLKHVENGDEVIGKALNMQVVKAIPMNMGVHKLQMSKGAFGNEKSATKWALINGYSPTKMVEEEEHFVIEVLPESDFVSGTLSDLMLTRGVVATVGELKNVEVIEEAKAVNPDQDESDTGERSVDEVMDGAEKTNGVLAEAVKTLVEFVTRKSEGGDNVVADKLAEELETEEVDTEEVVEKEKDSDEDMLSEILTSVKGVADGMADLTARVDALEKSAEVEDVEDVDIEEVEEVDEVAEEDVEDDTDVEEKSDETAETLKEAVTLLSGIAKQLNTVPGASKRLMGDDMEKSGDEDSKWNSISLFDSK